MTGPRLRLRLLSEVSWSGRAVPGERGHALLAALVSAGGRPVAEDDLVERVWGADQAANPTKALQVLVSRTRAHTGPELVGRTDRGYRLLLSPEDVDVLSLSAAVAAATSSYASGDLVRTLHQAEVVSATSVAAADAGELGDLRRRARAEIAVARRLLGQARSALGEHEAALPHLEEALVGAPDDEALLAPLLLSEAAVRGTAAALERYERHRRRLRDDLGSDPGPRLREVHAELLARDRPVRSGLRGDATALVGREDDLRALRAVVATSRVVTILGPGGLGKTRVAHLIAREAGQPVVHFVELVGVGPEDVVDEVGSSLGVRDSVSGRRVLTADQRADLRARIVQHLDRAPSLLVLDNCEHVLDIVADLVAALVATTSRVTVVTTSRAPLGIAAEHVFPLAQLDLAEAMDLFEARARAARPDVALPQEGVRRVVSRLDGLPLAIELAAARTRAMTVADIADRLADRFALLRGSDRSAPDRHRTLLAVVDWSWQLLDHREQEALERLALFQDGFGLAGATAVLGGDALECVTLLVDQSLLTVDGTSSTVRFRMLETVREFGLVRLREHGGEAAARLSLTAWASDLAAAATLRLWSRHQVATVEELVTEEGNLVEVLREAMATGDQATTVLLMAALGTAWTIRGEHTRVFSLAAAVEDVVTDWEPPEELVDATVMAMGVMLINTSIPGMPQPTACRALLARVGPGARQPANLAMARVMVGFDPDDDLASREFLARLQQHPDPRTRGLALQWSSHDLENAGDPERAIDVAERALALAAADDGPWSRALLHTQLAALHAQVGATGAATGHAVLALPLLDLLGARDDSMQVRGIMASSALEEGRVDEAEALIDRLCAEDADAPGGLGSRLVTTVLRAELDLARGRIEAGLTAHRLAVARLSDLRLPGLPPPDGFEPWTLLAESAAVTAHARHAPSGGEDLVADLRRKAPVLLDRGPGIDLPVAGLVVFGLGAWGLLRGDVPLAVALAQLAVAERLAYSRMLPTLSWPTLQAEAEVRAPGMLASATTRLGLRRGPELLSEARALVGR